MTTLQCTTIPTIPSPPNHTTKHKVVIVVGATGTGKSRLAIDLALRFSGEVINSDKIQVYKGLPITTNKVSVREARGVPHHLIGVAAGGFDFTAFDFCRSAGAALDSVVARGRLPIIAGGSNSFIDALVYENSDFRSMYECCFLWVSVSIPVLCGSLVARVHRMVESGLVEEVRGIYDPNADYGSGIRRAIGVPELEPLLRLEHFSDSDTRTRTQVLATAIREIEENNYRLAVRQIEKIGQLSRRWGERVHRVDGTEALLYKEWDDLVLGPASSIVERFVLEGPSSLPISTRGCFRKL